MFTYVVYMCHGNRGGDEALPLLSTHKKRDYWKPVQREATQEEIQSTGIFGSLDHSV